MDPAAADPGSHHAQFFGGIQVRHLRGAPYAAAHARAAHRREIPRGPDHRAHRHTSHPDLCLYDQGPVHGRHRQRRYRCSSFTNNAVAAFLLSAFACFTLYIAFEAISRLPAFRSGADYLIGQLGMDMHYKNISRGVIDSRDVIYFISVAAFFLFLTARNLVKR